MDKRLANAQRRRQDLEEADRLYHPCWCGVHVCGSSPDDASMTVLNIAASTPAVARKIFAACKAEAECPDGEEGDLVVDLNIDRDNLHVDDFWLNRQMLARMEAAGRAALAKSEEAAR